MSQTDKLISLTGLSRILNVIKEFVNNRINNTSKKIRHVEPMFRMVGELEVGSVTLNPNEYTIIDNAWDVDELKISVPYPQSGPTLTYSTNDYTCEFTLKDKSVKITLPSSVTKWRNGTLPSFEKGKTYVISIVNGLGTITAYSFVAQAAADDGE